MVDALIVLYFEFLIECFESAYLLLFLFVFSLQRDQIFEHVDRFDFDCFFIGEFIEGKFIGLPNGDSFLIANATLLVLFEGREDAAL